MTRQQNQNHYPANTTSQAATAKNLYGNRDNKHHSAVPKTTSNSNRRGKDNRRPQNSCQRPNKCKTPEPTNPSNNWQHPSTQRREHTSSQHKPKMQTHLPPHPTTMPMELQPTSVKPTLNGNQYHNQQNKELKNMLTLHFGFQVAPALPAWINVEQVQANQTPQTIDRQVSNLKFHNLCVNLEPPLLGLKAILGYDLKHRVQHKTPPTSQCLHNLRQTQT